MLLDLWSVSPATSPPTCLFPRPHSPLSLALHILLGKSQGLRTIERMNDFLPTLEDTVADPAFQSTLGDDLYPNPPSQGLLLGHPPKHHSQLRNQKFQKGKVTSPCHTAHTALRLGLVLGMLGGRGVRWSPMLVKGLAGVWLWLSVIPMNQEVMV